MVVFTAVSCLPLVPHSKPKSLLQSHEFQEHFCSMFAPGLPKFRKGEFLWKGKSGSGARWFFTASTWSVGVKSWFFVVQKDSGAGGEVWPLCPRFSSGVPKALLEIRQVRGWDEAGVGQRKAGNGKTAVGKKGQSCAWDNPIPLGITSDQQWLFAFLADWAINY